MISCKDVTKKICENVKHESFLKRIELKFHLIICKNCANYKKTMDYIALKAKELVSKKIKKQ